jgi:phosphoribosylglycinamide formyltransferase-1
MSDVVSSEAQSRPAGRDAGKGLRVAVLASGTGTNLQALLDQVHGRDGVEIVAVASNKPDARALARARAAQIPTAVFSLAQYGGDRPARDLAIGAWLREHDVQLVVLAGYMQILSESFLKLFPNAVINVHPALLPAFQGLDAVGQALRYGVKVFGVTVHFVDSGVDSGPVIAQRAVALPNARSEDDVFAVLHPIEHELLPEAVRLYARGALQLDPAGGRRVLIAG